MTTALLDSTVSKSIQEIDVDYVEPQASPMALRERGVGQTTDLELVFGQTHNGIECALCPTAERACDRAWFSAKQIETWSEMSTMTLWRWLGRLEKARRIASLSDMIKTSILDSAGVPHETMSMKRLTNPTLR